MAENKDWLLAHAKARLSEVVDLAISAGPQMITRNGKPTALVVSVDEWQKKTARTESLVEFLMASPLTLILNALPTVRETVTCHLLA